MSSNSAPNDDKIIVILFACLCRDMHDRRALYIASAECAILVRLGSLWVSGNPTLPVQIAQCLAKLAIQVPMCVSNMAYWLNKEDRSQ